MPCICALCCPVCIRSLYSRATPHQRCVVSARLANHDLRRRTFLLKAMPAPTVPTLRSRIFHFLVAMAPARKCSLQKKRRIALTATPEFVMVRSLQAIQNQHLQKYFKTKDFNFLSTEHLQKTGASVVVSSILLFSTSSSIHCVNAKKKGVTAKLLRLPVQFGDALLAPLTCACDFSISCRCSCSFQSCSRAWFSSAVR